MKLPTDTVVFTALAFMFMAAVWLGVAGPLLSAAQATTLLSFLNSNFGAAVVSALGTVGAGWLAWRAVQRQLLPAKQQSAAAAADTIVKAAKALEDENELLLAGTKDLQLTSILRDYDEENWLRIYGDWPQAVTEVAYKASELLSKHSKYLDRHDAGVLQEKRFSAVLALVELHESLLEIKMAFQLQTSGPDYEAGEDDISKEDAAKTRNRVEFAQIEWIRASTEFLEALQKQINTTWTRIRELERIAIGAN
jgi:hypothetical protein